ncbi:iron complex outermembrane receptor protein [Dysgonomonas alginatilytica]|uniref:Iron complex outermembrane receptor protein n=1 Tax=Dysgonomonas alginatilytica TaxID=1605892 RepID=A0A2V3PK92_9BACT|nr:TonB-dependent receptor [Dysgonomonas alginatilytica]PXV59315.1 iron complex outermembrane receptor protein [Dysgonomonas alginatilytica]
MKEKVRKSCVSMFLFCLIGILSLSTTYAQSGSAGIISGNVKDSQGETIIGASVVVKGSTVGTVTDFNGNFQVNASTGNTLVISYIGYKPQEIVVGNQKNISIVMKDDTELLSEVVVIGYGSVKKNDATGSVVAIKIDEKEHGFATTAQDLLMGKIAGVAVTTSGGRPGDGATIRIRGGSSLTATNDPLIIIDGVFMSNDLVGSSNPLSLLNPNDIETFTVLKDASATAIYGSRASNGVILVTTKKGVSGGKLKVTYDGNFSLSTRRNSVDLLTANEFRNFVDTRFANDDRHSVVMAMMGQANTNWQDEIFQTGFNTDQNISIYGSIGKAVPFRTSVGYTNEEGILRTSSMERVTANISLTPSLFDDHLKLNINGKGMFSHTRFAETGAIGSALSFDPTQPVMNGSQWGGFFTWTDTDGNLAPIAGKNPVAMLEMQNNRANVRNFIGNVQADYKLHFFPDLRLNLNVGLDIATTGGTDFKDPFNPTVYSQNDEQSGQRKDFTNFRNNQLMEFYGQYIKDVASLKSKFDVMGGYSWQHNKKTSDEDLWYVSKVDNSNIAEMNPGEDYYKFKEYYLISFFGRFNYTFNDKYLLTATVRRDGSSRFNKDNRWSVFPSVAFAWKMKEETFLKDVSVLSDLKLRVGWGKTGQQDLGDDYFYPSSPSYMIGGGQAYYPLGLNENGTINWVKSMRPNGYNPLLKWETTTTWNFGLDYGFLNNRINGAVDVYFRETTDLLNKEAPVVAGTSPAELLPQNIGTMENKGIEFAINARPIVSKEFEWQVGFNVAYNKSEITKLTATQDPGFKGITTGSTGGDGGLNAQIYATGYAPRTYFVYEQVYDNNGKPLEGVYVDRNKDGKVDENDLYYYKKPAADVLMGFNSKWLYKNWDLGFNGRISLGNYVYNASEANTADVSLTSIYANSVFLTNRPARALETNFLSKQALSDHYVQNGSFLKIDNITLGYTFNGLFKSATSARVYGIVQNPIVITKYRGLDPEVYDGMDYNFYPRPLIFMLGLNLNF